MDFSLSSDAEAFRDEARRFAEEHVTDAVVAEAHRTGTMHNWNLHRALGARRWIAAPWPSCDGGLDFSGATMVVLLEELHARRAPFDGWAVTMSGANALRDCGSATLRKNVLPKVLAGDSLIALGFTEPDAGSDVAAARTRAERDGESWILTGTKMFTTMAHEAEWILLLARTSVDGPKHAGLSMFLVPTETEGIEVVPVHTLGGERTNITFYNETRIGDEWRVGDVGDGWRVLTRSLNAERGSAFGAWPDFIGTSRKILDMSIEWYRRQSPDDVMATGILDRERIGRAATRHEVARLLGHRAIWAAELGVDPMVEAAMAKVFVTESLKLPAPT
jgi:alkylation response protein AidB-like acyl-CoA dehydrogenase